MTSKVDGNISDLFFNHDVADARVMGKTGRFVAWNRQKLLVEAESVIACLRGLGLSDLPTPAALVDDFLGRI